jgi:hypothetical protein
MPNLLVKKLITLVLNRSILPAAIASWRWTRGDRPAVGITLFSLVADFPPRRPGFKPGPGHAGFCDGQKWRWGRFSLRELRFPLHNLHSICFSTIIFTITQGWHNRPGVAALPVASQNKNKKRGRSSNPDRAKNFLFST